MAIDQLLLENLLHITQIAQRLTVTLNDDHHADMPHGIRTQKVEDRSKSSEVDERLSHSAQQNQYNSWTDGLYKEAWYRG